MSEQDMNSYRFLSGEEPGDERLCQIMIEVAADAIKRRQDAESVIREKVSRNRAILHKRWIDKINAVTNG